MNFIKVQKYPNLITKILQKQRTQNSDNLKCEVHSSTTLEEQLKTIHYAGHPSIENITSKAKGPNLSAIKKTNDFEESKKDNSEGDQRRSNLQCLPFHVDSSDCYTTPPEWVTTVRSKVGKGYNESSEKLLPLKEEAPIFNVMSRSNGLRRALLYNGISSSETDSRRLNLLNAPLLPFVITGVSDNCGKSMYTMKALIHTASTEHIPIKRSSPEITQKHCRSTSSSSGHDPGNKNPKDPTHLSDYRTGWGNRYQNPSYGPPHQRSSFQSAMENIYSGPSSNLWGKGSYPPQGFTSSYMNQRSPGSSYQPGGMSSPMNTQSYGGNYFNSVKGSPGLTGRTLPRAGHSQGHNPPFGQEPYVFIPGEQTSSPILPSYGGMRDGPAPDYDYSFPTAQKQYSRQHQYVTENRMPSEQAEGITTESWQQWLKDSGMASTHHDTMKSAVESKFMRSSAMDDEPDRYETRVVNPFDEKGTIKSEFTPITNEEMELMVAEMKEATRQEEEDGYAPPTTTPAPTPTPQIVYPKHSQDVGFREQTARYVPHAMSPRTEVVTPRTDFVPPAEEDELPLEPQAQAQVQDQEPQTKERVFEAREQYFRFPDEEIKRRRESSATDKRILEENAMEETGMEGSAAEESVVEERPPDTKKLGRGATFEKLLSGLKESTEKAPRPSTFSALMSKLQRTFSLPDKSTMSKNKTDSKEEDKKEDTALDSKDDMKLESKEDIKPETAEQIHLEEEDIELEEEYKLDSKDEASHFDTKDVAKKMETKSDTADDKEKKETETLEKLLGRKESDFLGVKDVEDEYKKVTSASNQESEKSSEDVPILKSDADEIKKILDTSEKKDKEEKEEKTEKEEKKVKKAKSEVSSDLSESFSELLESLRGGKKTTTDAKKSKSSDKEDPKDKS